jgi:hypothetical protein
MVSKGGIPVSVGFGLLVLPPPPPRLLCRAIQYVVVLYVTVRSQSPIYEIIKEFFHPNYSVIFCCSK